MPRGVQLRELEFKQKMAAKKMQRFFRAMKASKVARAARVKKSRVSFQKYNLHRFHRFGDALTIDVSSTTSINGMSFSLNQVRGYADFADLYDRYMITCVVLKFRLISNPDAMTQLNTVPDVAQKWNTTNWFPKLYYCPDYDDSNSETLNQLKERAQTKLKILRPNQYVTVVVKPAVTIQTYATVTTTGYAPKWRQWIDMAQQDIPHYGLKYVVDCTLDPNDSYPFKIEIERKYYIACKDVR